MKKSAAQYAPRPVRGPALCAVVMLGIAGVAWALRAVWQVRLAVAGVPASGLPDQGEGRHRPLTALENSYHVVSAVGDVATLFCAAFFIMWLWQVRDNARTLSGHPPRYLGIWVYAGWIVPIVNLWFPRGIVADAFRGSAPDRPLPRSVNVWWALWLIGMLTDLGLNYSGSTDAMIARAYSNVSTLLVADLAVVGAAIAAIVMVRTLTALQLERFATDLRTPSGDPLKESVGAFDQD
ncbi:DUF4328 domain-containing protein [Streptomyces sp. NPDC047072]|uniref:DUF4328 domain-containing protein n=1 Tax=Streptomyces sp. NPDC047072 TaxID=3154809 RepID=UPI0033FD8650